MMIRRFRILSLLMAAVVLTSSCSTLSTISSTQPDVYIRIMDKPSALAPVKEELSVTTFGSYRFMAEKKGSDPLYGVIPLYVNVGYIILDALFFAPTVLFNARSAYSFYEIDYDKAIIRYSDDGKHWYDYKIISEEIDHSRNYYNDLKAQSSVSKK